MQDKELLRQYEALVKFFIKKELKIKEAVCFDKRVRYFRSKPDQYFKTCSQP